MTLMNLPLAHAALEIARGEYPELPVELYLKQLDQMSRELERKVRRAGRSKKAQLEALTKYLFNEKRFRGNSINYFDPKNNFLNDVLDRKVGLPITLSILTLELAQKLGLKAWGVGLPSHFMVAISTHGKKAPVFVDPFHGGQRMTEVDLLKQFQGKPEQIQTMDKRAILTRLLNNLKIIYWTNRNFDKVLPIVERLLELNPDAMGEIRDRGIAFFYTGQRARAWMDLEAYLAHLETEARKAGTTELRIPPEEAAHLVGMVNTLRQEFQITKVLQ